MACLCLCLCLCACVPVCMLIASARTRVVARPGEEGVFVVSRDTGELHYYEAVAPSQPPRHVTMPPFALARAQRLSGDAAPLAVHYDYLDARIDICSPEARAPRARERERERERERDARTHARRAVTAM
jgi:hypothetical protein